MRIKGHNCLYTCILHIRVYVYKYQTDLLTKTATIAHKHYFFNICEYSYVCVGHTVYTNTHIDRPDPQLYCFSALNKIKIHKKGKKQKKKKK